MSCSVQRAAARFLKHCRAAKTLSPLTLQAYESDLRDFARHLRLRTQVARVDRETLRGYIQTLFASGLKASTVKRRLATLKLFFRWLEREGVVDQSAFYRLDLSIRLPRRLPRALDADEMRSLLTRARSEARWDRDRTYDATLTEFAVIVLLATGLRIGELVGTRLPDVSVSDGSIRVKGKGNRERRVFLSGRRAARALDVYLEARRCVVDVSDRFLLAHDGSPITAPRLRRRLSTLARNAGIARRVTPHMLRHTAATQLLEAGVDIRFVQRLLGHASISTTQIYTEVRDQALRARLDEADILSRILRAS
jgi:site-specific recombinase XerD